MCGLGWVIFECMLCGEWIGGSECIRRSMGWLCIKWDVKYNGKCGSGWGRLWIGVWLSSVSVCGWSGLVWGEELMEDCCGCRDIRWGGNCWDE